MLKTVLIFIGSVLLCAIISFSVSHIFYKSKILVVDSNTMIEEFDGIKKANEIFYKEKSLVDANVDTLKNRYERLIEKYQYEVSETGKEIIKPQLEIAEDRYYTYLNTSKEELENRRLELYQEEIVFINKQIKLYAEEKGVDIIVGSTLDGEVLYSKEKYNITQDILKYLNEKYNDK